MKIRPMCDHAFWIEHTHELAEFIASSPTRTWSEIRAWGRARKLGGPVIDNAVAFLDVTRRIRLRDDGTWEMWPDDGAAECPHGRWSCEACAWAAGFRVAS